MPSTIKVSRSVRSEKTSAPGKAPSKRGPESAPPSAQQQAEPGSDEEKGPQEEEDFFSAESEEEKEKGKQLAPVLAPKLHQRTRASQRSAPTSSTSRPKDGYRVDGRKMPPPAPYLALYSLGKEYSPQIYKPAKVQLFVPSFLRLSEIHSAVSSIVSPVRSVHKKNPIYTSVFTRTALAYCYLYKILISLEKSSELGYEEAKVLKQLRNAHDFDAQIIPGPYVGPFCSIGFHVPKDKRYDVLCPTLPEFDNYKNVLLESASKACALHFPSFTALRFLCQQIIEGDALKTLTKTGGHEQAFITKKGKFVPFTIGTDFTADHPFFASAGFRSSATRAQFVGTMHNSALQFPFFDQPDDLNVVSLSYPGKDIPLVDHTGTVRDAPDLLTYFGLKKGGRWLAPLLDCLTYEATFFDGSATLLSTGYEVGTDALTTVSFGYTADALEGIWHSELPYADSLDVVQVSSHSDEVTDDDMRISLVNQTIVNVRAATPATSDLLKAEGMFIPELARSPTSMFNQPIKKVTLVPQTIGHRIPTLIRSEMLKPNAFDQ
jgi:hypothetical protein